MRIRNKTLTTFIICLLFSAFANTVDAQWTDMVWGANNFNFKMPSQFTILQNDTNNFAASGTTFTMVFKNWEADSVLSLPAVCMDAINEIPAKDLAIVDQRTNNDQEGLWGFEAELTATQQDKLMHILVGTYQDMFQLTVYTIKVVYWDDPDQNQTNFDAANFILANLKVVR